MHAQASTCLKVARLHIRFINVSRIGTRAMMRTGNAGPATVNVMMKMIVVAMIWVIVNIAYPTRPTPGGSGGSSEGGVKISKTRYRIGLRLSVKLRDKSG